MNETERKILEALQDLDSSIKSMASSGAKPDLLPIFQRIEALRDALPKSSSQDLLHYLHKHSYEKARLWLEGRAAEAVPGSCHH